MSIKNDKLHKEINKPLCNFFQKTLDKILLMWYNDYSEGEGKAPKRKELIKMMKMNNDKNKMVAILFLLYWIVVFLIS